MRGFHLPIMIGLYDQADKTSVVAKDQKLGGYSLFICRLKNRMERGAQPDKDNIGKVICHIHFCNLDAAKVFQKGVNWIIETWEKEAQA